MSFPSIIQVLLPDCHVMVTVLLKKCMKKKQSVELMFKGHVHISFLSKYKMFPF